MDTATEAVSLVSPKSVVVQVAGCAVCSMGIFRFGKKPQIVLLTVCSKLRAPLVRVAIPVDALKPALVIAVFAGVCLVLRSSRVPKIRFGVIESVPVNVVDFKTFSLA